MASGLKLKTSAKTAKRDPSATGVAAWWEQALQEGKAEPLQLNPASRRGNVPAVQDTGRRAGMAMAMKMTRTLVNEFYYTDSGGRDQSENK